MNEGNRVIDSHSREGQSSTASRDARTVHSCNPPQLVRMYVTASTTTAAAIDTSPTARPSQAQPPHSLHPPLHSNSLTTLQHTTSHHTPNPSITPYHPRSHHTRIQHACSSLIAPQYCTIPSRIGSYVRHPAPPHTDANAPLRYRSDLFLLSRAGFCLGR